jgi:hypothetical protein
VARAGLVGRVDERAEVGGHLLRHSLRQLAHIGNQLPGSELGGKGSWGTYIFRRVLRGFALLSSAGKCGTGMCDTQVTAPGAEVGGRFSLHGGGVQIALVHHAALAAGKR